MLKLCWQKYQQSFSPRGRSLNYILTLLHYTDTTIEIPNPVWRNWSSSLCLSTLWVRKLLLYPPTICTFTNWVVVNKPKEDTAGLPRNTFYKEFSCVAMPLTHSDLSPLRTNTPTPSYNTVLCFCLLVLCFCLLTLCPNHAASLRISRSCSFVPPKNLVRQYMLGIIL